jgi:hypothetical protein
MVVLCHMMSTHICLAQSLLIISPTAETSCFVSCLLWLCFEFWIRALLEKLIVSHPVCQEIPHLLWNPNIHYLVCRILPLDPFLKQFRPVHTLTPILLRCARSPGGIFSIVFQLQFYIYFSFQMHAACSTYLLLLLLLLVLLLTTATTAAASYYCCCYSYCLLLWLLLLLLLWLLLLLLLLLLSSTMAVTATTTTTTGIVYFNIFHLISSVTSFKIC